MSEARGNRLDGVERRLDRLEADIRDVRQTLGELVPLIHRIDQRLTSELPQLASKSELADKPGKLWLATAIGVLLVAYVAGLAAVTALPVVAKLVH